MGPYANYLLNMLLTLSAVGALAFVMLYGLRKIGGIRPSGGLKVVGQLALDTRRTVYLIKLGENILVVGVGDGSFTKLAEVPATSIPEGTAESAPFARVFAQALSRPKKDGAPS